MTKKELLKPRLLESVNRMLKLIENDAPGTLIGFEAFNIFATTLSVYGEEIAKPMIKHIHDQNLQSRGVCINDGCANFVEDNLSEVGMCNACEAVLKQEFEGICHDPV